jgi:rubrerythrin
MTANTLNVLRLARVDRAGTEEVLEFHRGLNVVVGKENAGKTKWLTFLDFLLGDTDSPEEALGDEALKYNAVSASISISGEIHSLERRWDQYGTKGKIVIDGVPIRDSEFSKEFLTLLNIPILHYPKGDRYQPARWNELSWRNLLRHIYRREDSWQEFAHKQWEVDQFPVFMMFFGAAPAVFSSELNQLIRREKQRLDLQAQREHFLATLESVGTELLTVDEAKRVDQVGVDESLSRLQKRIVELQQQRESRIADFSTATREESTEQERSERQRLETRFAELHRARATIRQQVTSAERRSEELHAYETTLRHELAKLERTQAAGEILADLRITHCPLCDQEVTRIASPGSCRVCLQPYDDPTENRGSERIDFEVLQLRDELRELAGLSERIDQEAAAARLSLRDLDEDQERITAFLRPSSPQEAALPHAETSVIDQEIGRLQERIRQLHRFHSALLTKDRLDGQIHRLSREIERLKHRVSEQRDLPNLDDASELFTEAMHEYVRALNTGKDRLRWSNRDITIDATSGDMRFMVNGRRWDKKLGAILKAYFLLAYQYALLKLSQTEPFVYPGFAIIDFPANLTDGIEILQHENYLLEPFVSLLEDPHYRELQVIVAGRAFDNLRGAHRTELQSVWT